MDFVIIFHASMIHDLSVYVQLYVHMLYYAVLSSARIRVGYTGGNTYTKHRTR